MPAPSRFITAAVLTLAAVAGPTLGSGETLSRTPTNTLLAGAARALVPPLAVAAAAPRHLDRPARVVVAGYPVVVTLRQLGVTATMRRSDGEGPLLEQRVADIATTLAHRLDARPVDASLDLVAGVPRWGRARDGRVVDKAAVVRALLASFDDGRVRHVATRAVPPAIQDSHYATVLVVRTGTNVLELYRNGRRDRTYRVATGAPDFPTPRGRFTITARRYLPTWFNPGSDWGKDLPKSIGPGPGNPLGTRALNLSAPNIRIHGTPAAWSIGYSVSHGCIRMRMRDVEALYPLVPMGATVFIT
ncbi:MAG TPA: L,D-transpeptidase [Mycobacteriales bacterium]|nr:L,D-transpeptidase [Mycobacteriales bacterium]